jgi:tetratricopeptide (TPR) repeat protein
VVLSNIAMDQGHDADALAEMRTYAALLNAHGVEELGAEAFAFERPQSIALVAELAGDYRTAANNFPDPKRQWLRGTAEILSLALEHDPAGARDALAAFRPGHMNQSGVMPTADAAVAQGGIALQTGDWRAARDSFERAETLAHEIDERSHGVYSDRAYREARAAPRLAFAYAMLGDKAKALAILQALPLDCDLCVRYRGKLEAAGRNWFAAAHWFALVSARSPDIPFADTDWGAMLMAKGDLDGAVAKFESAHRKGPHFADPLEMWGEVLIARNRSDLALAKFEEANKYAPNWGRLHLKWGEAWWWSGNKDEARKQFATASRLDLSTAERSQLARLART